MAHKPQGSQASRTGVDGKVRPKGKRERGRLKGLPLFHFPPTTNRHRSPPTEAGLLLFRLRTAQNRSEARSATSTPNTASERSQAHTDASKGHTDRISGLTHSQAGTILIQGTDGQTSRPDAQIRPIRQQTDRTPVRTNTRSPETHLHKAEGQKAPPNFSHSNTHCGGTCAIFCMGFVGLCYLRVLC